MNRTTIWVVGTMLVAVASGRADAAVVKSGKNFATRTCPCEQRDAAVAGAKNGVFMVGWHGRTEDEIGAAAARVFTEDGQAQGAQSTINAPTRFLSERQVDLANGGPKDQFVAAWATAGTTNNTDVYLRRYSNAGQPLGAPFLAHTDDAAAPTAEHLPALAMTADGGFAVAYLSVTLPGVTVEPGQASIRLRRFDSAGKPLGKSIEVNSGLIAGQRPAVCIDASSGDAIVAWPAVDKVVPFQRTPVGVRLRRVGSDGSLLGDEVTLAAAVLVTTSVSLSCAPGGGFVATWESNKEPGVDSNIIAARFDESGRRLGGNFGVPSDKTWSETRPGVSHDPGGNFVVVWQERTDSAHTIQGRRFHASGKPDGGDFEVISRPLDGPSITSPDVAHRGTKGDFVVVFEKLGTVNGQLLTLE